MYHIIPLMPEEMALLASVLDGDCADIAAIASCTPYGDDGLAVLCLEERERKGHLGASIERCRHGRRSGPS
jgi:hypothetical protein